MHEMVCDIFGLRVQHDAIDGATFSEVRSYIQCHAIHWYWCTAVCCAYLKERREITRVIDGYI